MADLCKRFYLYIERKLDGRDRVFTVTGGHLGFKCAKAGGGGGVGACGGKGRVAACKLSGRACLLAG